MAGIPLGFLNPTELAYGLGTGGGPGTQGFRCHGEMLFAGGEAPTMGENLPTILDHFPKDRDEH